MAQEPFIVYKASAGSGKTHTLVREYIKMAFSLGEGRLGEALRSILAITFTNKAAAEMKDRILDELRQMASAPADADSGTMGGDLLRELAPRVDAQGLQRMAEKMYKTILHRYSDLSVSTIDSFTHRLVRTFAHDFGQPMNFDVTLDAKELTAQAVAQLMSLAGTEGHEELTEVLKDFADSEMESEDTSNSYDIERKLTKMAKELFKEDIGTHLKQLSGLKLSDYRDIRNDYCQSQSKAEEALRRCGADALGALHGAGLDSGVCFQGAKGFYGWFAKLADGKTDEPGKYATASMTDGKLCGAKATPGQQAAMEALAPSLRAYYGEALGLLAQRNTYIALRRDIYSVALLGELDRQMHLYTRENDMVHLSDFNRMINERVEDEDNPAPFIFERIGNRYRHFLIDEFQDTSIMQWHNMVPLMENGVSQGQESLVVGDGKQSIYRFRQGDVAQFVRLPRVEGMRHHGHTLGMGGNSAVRNIDTNRRSFGSIIDFNNKLFSFLARDVYTDNPMVQDIYIGHGPDGALNAKGQEELLQKKHKKEEGYVELDIVSKGEAEEGGFKDVEEAIFDRVGATITAMHDERGYTYHDIVVLTRTNNELAALSEYLSAHYPAVRQTSTESFYLNKSHAVMAIMATLRLVVNRDDRVAQTELKARLDALGLGGEPDIDLLASMNLYDCCEEIVRELHLDGIDTLYVASLLNRAAAFAARHKQEPGQFVEWFDEQSKLSAAASEDIDAVRLLTIHKAKGLDGNVVICPMFFYRQHAAKLWVELENSLGNSGKRLPTTMVKLTADKKTIFENKRHTEQLMDEVDQLNTMYVAFTRARQQMYIFCPDIGDVKNPPEHDRRAPTLLKAFAPEGYRSGDSTMKKVADKEKEGKKVVTLTQLSFADWSQRVSIASPSEKALTSLLEDRRRFGIYAHDLLAAVRHADDVEGAVERLAADRSLGDDEREALAALARRAVSDPQTARFFDPRYEAKNECSLMAAGVTFRPDRVVVTPTETWVVDFKTGAPEKEHNTQVLNYCALLRNMGYPQVSGYLMYLTPEISVVECR